jgi:hypothetical protein
MRDIIARETGGWYDGPEVRQCCIAVSLPSVSLLPS